MPAINFLDLTDPFASEVIQVAPDIRAWHMRERQRQSCGSNLEPFPYG